MEPDDMIRVPPTDTPVEVRCAIGLSAEDSSMTTAEQPLFSGEYLSTFLERIRQDAQEQLVNWHADYVLGSPDADLIEALLKMTTRECPTLRRSEAHLLEPTEVNVRVTEFDMQVIRRVTQFTLVVPFDGDTTMFAMRATMSTTSPPRAILSAGELNFLSRPRSREVATIKINFDTQLDELDRFLAWSRHDINAHRERMEVEIPSLVANRRTKLLADRDLHANIGFPIKRRKDADTYTVPLRRRQVAARTEVATVPTEPFKPEPVLPDGDYEAALAVLRNARNALERSPSTTNKLGEEQIRDLLLVSLNAQFEGKAAGEVFNGAGKTDILIRVNDRNVFIGECKFWKGPKTITDTLDQLLGYLVWRDTKAALLLFIRDADVTAVMAKAVIQVEQHSNYKRRGTTSTEERHDFVLHAPGDPAREIHLALLPFLIARK
jgi:hypothetical protein